MKDRNVSAYLEKVLENMPNDWLKLTTHRLDIYDESLAKAQFLNQFEKLFENGDADPSALAALPTAYDYIRLGHPLSSVLEWAIAKMNGLRAEQLISFASKTIPLMAILRKNLMDQKKTKVFYIGSLPSSFDVELLQRVYGYQLELIKLDSIDDLPNLSESANSTVLISQQDDFQQLDFTTRLKEKGLDFIIRMHPQLGSVLLINAANTDDYIAAIQHVRRRETVAMTPPNSHAAIKSMLGKAANDTLKNNAAENQAAVHQSINAITKTNARPLLASSGLSIQYAIMMGLVHHALDNHPGKDIKFIVPPNCYGGTNDQARRVAACNDKVEVVDLPVDGDNDMVQSIDRVLDQTAAEDAVPYIIAEIPTNPRVEVPDLDQLKNVLSAERKTEAGAAAIAPVFILDQTFCPNVHFLGEGEVLSEVKTIAYVSGSKFPSGGLCTAGYCVANEKAEGLLDNIETHLKLCDNEATSLQVEILAKQLPSMNQRIKDAYKNTRAFVNYIRKTLPEAKINFVSEELASQGFTPSVFSLDLPTKGKTAEEKEANKRALNLKLIKRMISEIPNESKFCVSYGQLKGCYWTVPATSTQGTTKEGDKDYIVRVSVSPDLNLELHKKVFKDFVEGM